MWDYIILGILIFVLVGLIISTVLVDKKNSDSRTPGTELYPFSGMSDLKKANGENQISCPVGQSINITGAFIDVYDPFSQCTTSPLPSYIEMCKNSSTSTECQNIIGGENYQNSICSPSNTTNNCKPRDITYNIGKLCNGKSDCNVNISQVEDLPLPCQNLTTTTYSKLPKAEGKSGYQIHGLFSCS
jgi:hypothetical protein